MKVFRFVSVTAVIVADVLCTGIASSQQKVGAAPGGDLRAQTIAASFNKTKHKVKEKNGVRRGRYLDVHSVPAVKSNPADYSGAYKVPELAFSLRLHVNPNGMVEGTGYDALNDAGTVGTTFTLKNGRISGALITATKVYSDESSEPFEGVFLNKTTRESPKDKGVTTFGLGVIGKRIQLGELNVERLFYELKQ